MPVKRSFFWWSKSLHRYVGLSMLAVFLFMGITGVLINHPSLLKELSVPVNWLGNSYRYENWNRFSFRDSVPMPDGGLYVAGKLGVFFSSGPGIPFREANKGLPAYLYGRDINSLLSVEHGDSMRLYGGGRNGLYYMDDIGAGWQRISSAGDEEIVDVILSSDRIAAFSHHGCFTAPAGQATPDFKPAELKFDSSKIRVPGYRLFFEMHSGKILDFAGRIMVDSVALVLAFLSLSAVYLWFVPWKRRRFVKRKRKYRLLAPLYSYHLKLGIWGAAFIFTIAVTGTFVRPPLILATSFWSVPFSMLMLKSPEIMKAAVIDNTIFIATRDGWFEGSADLNSVFAPVTPPLPVFGMGTTVLKPLADSRLLVGSFSGLYKWNLDSDVAVDLDGKEPVAMEPGRPGEVMAAGAVVHSGKLAGYADYKKGFVGLDGSGDFMGRFPGEIMDERVPLYNFLFELHNGRFLRDGIGAWYILYIPLAGLALMLVVATGVYDWSKRKIKRMSGKKGQ